MDTWTAEMIPTTADILLQNMHPVKYVRIVTNSFHQSRRRSLIEFALPNVVVLPAVCALSVLILSAACVSPASPC